MINLFFKYILHYRYWESVFIDIPNSIMDIALFLSLSLSLSVYIYIYTHKVSSKVESVSLKVEPNVDLCNVSLGKNGHWMKI